MLPRAFYKVPICLQGSPYLHRIGEAGFPNLRGPHFYLTLAVVGLVVVVTAVVGLVVVVAAVVGLVGLMAGDGCGGIGGGGDGCGGVGGRGDS